MPINNAERAGARTPRAALYRKALREASKKRPDMVQVRSLLELAQKGGDADAAYALGTWFLHGKHVPKDYRKAVTLLRQAVAGNVANALYDLAVCYEKGAGIKRSPKRALEYYLRAALRGEAQSVYEVGRCFYYGIGTIKNRTLAWVWLDRARELGVAEKASSENTSDSAHRGRSRPAPGRGDQGGGVRAGIGVPRRRRHR